jgi:hypothetical protein
MVFEKQLSSQPLRIDKYGGTTEKTSVIIDFHKRYGQGKKRHC